MAESTIMLDLMDLWQSYLAGSATRCFKQPSSLESDEPQSPNCNCVTDHISSSGTIPQSCQDTVDKCRRLNLHQKIRKKTLDEEAARPFLQVESIIDSGLPGESGLVDLTKSSRDLVDEYTEIFEDLFLDSDSNHLKQKIVESLMSVEGVETVAVGFSTEKAAKAILNWPVIRVTPNERTCKNISKSTKEFVDKVSLNLQESLSKCFLKSCTLTFLTSTIEIVLNYPIKESVLRTCDGENLTTTYKFADHKEAKNKTDKRQGKTTCTVQNRLIISREGHCDPVIYEAQYKVACLHPIVPTNCQSFWFALPPLPSSRMLQNKLPATLSDPNTTHDASPKTLQHKIIKQCISDLVHVVGPKNDLRLMPTILRLTLFPNDAAKAFDQMEKNCEFRCKVDQTSYSDDDDTSRATIRRHCQEVKFLFGKAGLFEQTTNSNDEGKFLFVLTDNSALDNPSHNPFQRHPCNIDIGIYLLNQALEAKTNCTGYKLQAENDKIKIPANPSWREPPSKGSIRNMWGTVVYIKEGTVCKLSDQLSVIRGPVVSNGCIYPTYMWVLDSEAKVSPGDSGSPVFLFREDTFYLIGSLITEDIASPINFGLKLVRADIAVHHIQQIITRLSDSEIYTASEPAGSSDDLVSCSQSDDQQHVNDQQHNDQQHNDQQHNDQQHNHLALRSRSDDQQQHKCNALDGVDASDLIKYLEKYERLLESHKEEQNLSPLPIVTSRDVTGTSIIPDIKLQVELNIVFT